VELTCVVSMLLIFCFVLGSFLVSLLCIFVLVIALKLAITLLCNCDYYYYYYYYCVLRNSVQFSLSSSDLVVNFTVLSWVFSVLCLFVTLGLCITVDFLI